MWALFVAVALAILLRADSFVVRSRSQYLYRQKQYSDESRGASLCSSSITPLLCKSNEEGAEGEPEGEGEEGTKPWMGWMKNPPKLSLPNIFLGSLAGVFLTFASLVLSVDGFVGIHDGSSSGPVTPSTAMASIIEDVTLFEDIPLDLQNDYVDNIDPQKLCQTGVKAMLQSLDQYTEFTSAK
jgi:hypothetical protein